MGTGRGWDVGAELSSDPSRNTRWEVAGAYDRDELGSRGFSVSSEWSARPRQRFELSFQPVYWRSVDARQYVTSRSRGPASTFGRRYVFAALEQSEISVRARLNYTVTPALSLESYVEPFAASGRFFDYGELLAAGSRELRMYGTAGTTAERTTDGLRVAEGNDRFTVAVDDFNVRSFRSNLVVRWEWRPGSTAFLVWQQSLASETPDGRLVRPSGLWQAFSGRGDNFLVAKVSYWLPVH
jgi:hypothetical protein